MAADSSASCSGDHNPRRQHHDPFTPCGTKRGRSSTKEEDDADAATCSGYPPSAMDVMITSAVELELRQRPPAPVRPDVCLSALQPAASAS